MLENRGWWGAGCWSGVEVGREQEESGGGRVFGEKMDDEEKRVHVCIPTHTHMDVHIHTNIIIWISCVSMGVYV